MNLKQKLIYIYFIILPFIDLVTSLITRFVGEGTLSLGMLVKGLTLLFGVVYVILFSKSRYRKISIGYFLMLMIFTVIYLFTKMDVWNLGNIVNEIVYAFRYFYFPVMICCVFNIFDDFRIDNKFIKKILMINCISYVVLLLIPYLTGTGFNSYSYAGMFGENGWFYAANETGAIMTILSSCILYFLDFKKKYKILIALPILFSVMLIGTKVSSLGLIAIVIMICFTNFIQNKNEVKKINKFVFPIILILFLTVICMFSPALTNLEGRIDDVSNQEVVDDDSVGDTDNSEYNYKYDTIEDLIPNRKIANIFTIVFSGRTDFFLKNYSIYSEALMVDKLFGLGWNDRESINYYVPKKLVEIDFLDIFLHYGIVGFFIYFLPLLYFLIDVVRRYKLIKLECLFYIFVLLLSLGISSLSGHVLAAPAVSIYLILIMYIISSFLDDNKKLNNNEVTILALHLGVGGIEKYLSSLCKMLQDDYKINIITTYKLQEKPAFYFDDSIKITYLINDKPNRNELLLALKNRKILNIFTEGFKCIKILYLKNVRNIRAIKNINSKYVITTRDFHSNLLGIYGDKNIIKIATEHNYHNNDKKYINKIVRSLAKFDYFVVVSENLKKFYQDKVGSTKCIYIPNVIDELPNKKSTLEQNSIINIGRFEKEKGQFDLIDIVRELKKEITDIKLFLIGDGSLKKDLEKQVSEYGLQDNVIFTGFLSKEEMEKYLLKTKLFVMTSYTESFGLVLIEAMSYGVPCIAFDSADGAKSLLKNKNGILIENRNKKLMVKEIVKLLKNNNLLSKYSSNGYKKCQEFLIDNVKKQWLNLLNR